MKKFFILILYIILYSPAIVFAVEAAPRISDREIIEELANIRGDIKELRAEIRANTEAVKQLREDNAEAVKQLREDNAEAVKQLREDNTESIKQLREDIRWMFGILVTIAVVVLGFMLRMQWQMHRRQTQMETTLEAHKDEFLFLKSLIEKLLPPKGVL
ncbi:MAG: hypothetical protein HZA01_15150 [Nitrospinae bacterium]|nr:hypothetical protein [Nitrospinota bacterium]